MNLLHMKHALEVAKAGSLSKASEVLLIAAPNISRSIKELEADLPGFEKKDIQLDISGDTLTVSAERHSRIEEKDKKEKVVRVERSYGSYSRSFDISGVDTDQIKAKYENGVLKLTLPKKQVTLPEGRRLEIE